MTLLDPTVADRPAAPLPAPAALEATAWACAGLMTLAGLLLLPEPGALGTVAAAGWASAATWWLARRTHARRLAEAVRVAEQHAQQTQLALHDELTGLPRRALVLDRLDHAVTGAARAGSRVGVVFLDVDGMKQVNDAQGHAAGDELLVAVAQRLTSVVRASDTAARLGGDEFLVVCEGLAGPDDLAAATARLSRALTGEVEVLGRRTPLSVSLGAALHEPGESTSALLRRADARMYDAKAVRRSVDLRSVPLPRGVRTRAAG